MTPTERSQARHDAAKKANRETVVIRQAFVGLTLYCFRCRRTRVAPWIPAVCPGCESMLRIEQ